MVHVAGTNGKGSVVAFLKAIAEKAGYRVNAYTSPHLVRFNERIQLGGKPIGNRLLSELLAACEVANAGRTITFFEITTACAFLAFRRMPADMTLIETGLGGRFDATNVIARPALTAITPVSRDHMHFLGNALSAIAFEKAGILKRHVPAIIGPQRPAAMRVIARRARALSAPLVRFGTDFEANAGVKDGFVYAEGKDRFALPAPALLGAHQRDNAAIAIACARRLPSLAIDQKALAQGLLAARWPARMQRLTRGPIVEALSPGVTLWLDGGHNQAAGQALAQTAAQWSDAPLYLVCGMIDSKQPAGFLKPLAGRATALRAVPVPGQPSGISAESLAAQARRAGIAAEPASSVADAIRGIIAAEPGRARILICGSLYLAGAVLRDNG